MSPQHRRLAALLLALGLLGLAGAWLGGRHLVAPASGADAPAGKAEKPTTVKPLEGQRHVELPADPRWERDLELRDILDKVVDYPGLDVKDTKLGEALEQLAKIHQITFDVNDRTFKKDLSDVHFYDVKVADPPIEPMKTQLRDVLEKLLSRVPSKSPATYLIRRNHIEITTERAVRAELGIRGTGPLLPLVLREFKRERLSAALEAVAQDAGMSVFFDRRAVPAEARVTARLRNVPIDTALSLLADTAGLDVVRRDNAFYVTTPKNAARLRKRDDFRQQAESAPAMQPAKKPAPRKK